MRVALEKRDLRIGGGIQWVSCRPFVENSRAVLIHRVRYVTTHKIGPKYPSHIAVHGWCGNASTGTKKFTFLDEPPEGRVVCARCEDAATGVGLPASSEIAGRHVHTGGVVAHMRCCKSAEPTP